MVASRSFARNGIRGAVGLEVRLPQRLDCALAEPDATPGFGDWTRRGFTVAPAGAWARKAGRPSSCRRVPYGPGLLTARTISC